MSIAVAQTAPAAKSASTGSRWTQLLLGLVAMMAISSPQYVWALFVKPMQAATGASLAGLQVTFSILIVLQTWFSPLQGVLIDRFGPRAMISAGALLTGLSWVLAASASSLVGLYLSYGLLGGLGTGIIYVGIIGLMVKWFPDRRGLATGVVAAGYGFGALFTTFPISSLMQQSGYQHALTVFGLILAGVGVLAAQGLRMPPKDATGASVAGTGALALRFQARESVTPRQMLRTPIFWLLFVMMTMMSTGGLMVISQMGAFAKDFGVSDVTVFGLAALPLALSLDRITNGLTRPFFGWVSDRIGRENTMALAFILEGLSILLLVYYRDNALAFVLLSGLVFFGWGEIFSLFPSTLTDTFGPRHATVNYGFLYMAQGVGSVLGGPVAALLHQQTGNWMPVFALIVTMDILTGMLALFALKPMRRRWLGRSSEVSGEAQAAPA
ncbi:MAG TPA: oxalate/formate MFS antiporter [Casimicrobiaceae bacterium]|nr:oxalate/formate MFS antiporter [Casimicrobiaceae bacterium]